MRNCTKHFLLLTGPSGGLLHLFPKVKGHQLRVLFIANHAVFDTEVRALIVVCKSKTCRLALRSVKDGLPLPDPFCQDVNSGLSN